MNFIKSKTDLYLENTELENLFIYEYMPSAKGDYVKVYLLARMYADRDVSFSNEDLAKELNLPYGEILNAWDYWASKKVIIKHGEKQRKFDYDIEFVSLKKLMFGERQRISEEKSNLKKLNSSAIQPEMLQTFSKVEQILGRTLGSLESHDLKMWIQDWGLEEKVILKAYEQCRKNKKLGDHSYLSAIVKSWNEKGLLQLDSLEEYLAENDKRHHLYKRIFRALGFHGRFPTEEEERIMDIWFDEYLFDISTVLDACKKTAGISRPSISYIHAILKSWYEEKNGISREGAEKDETFPSKGSSFLPNAMKEFERIRKENAALHKNRIQEIHQSFPRIREIDGEIKELNPKMLKLLLSGQNKSSIYKTMERELINLQKEKGHILVHAGYQEDYLEPIYTCKKCKDTGFMENGEKCICLLEKLDAISGKEKKF